MTADQVYDKLTAAECETVAERFVRAMYAQASGKNRGEVTAATLTELWQDVLAWTGCDKRPQGKP